MRSLSFLCFLLLPAFFLPAAKVAAQTNYPAELTVDVNGHGDYKSINAALNAFRPYSPVALKLHIKNGIYTEKVVLPTWLCNLTIDGESRDSTIISYGDYSGKLLPAGLQNDAGTGKFSTFNSYTFYIGGNDIVLANLTIRNSAGAVGQAVALHIEGDRVVVRNCNLLGHQDTIFTGNDTSRQYFVDCLIEGTTDFIFGPATVLFQRCTIKSLSESYITAASTRTHQPFGYIFQNCRLTAKDSTIRKVYLGRPWRANARTVFMNTEMGAHIRPEGWHNWGKPENEQTTFYAEYKNSGPGANRDARVKWSKTLTDKEARQYSLANIFGNWKPAKP